MSTSNSEWISPSYDKDQINLSTHYLINTRNYSGDRVKEFSTDDWKSYAQELDLSRKEDYLWNATRHAEAYAVTFCCGRAKLKDLMKSGVDEDMLRFAQEHYFHSTDLFAPNPKARWYGIFFGQIVPGEDAPKVWFKFPGDNRLYWYIIKGNERDFELIPDPRNKASMSKLYMYGEEPLRFLRDYPETFKYNRNECYRFLQEYQGRAEHMRKWKYTGFLIEDPPEFRSGDGIRDDIKNHAPITQGDNFYDRNAKHSFQSELYNMRMKYDA